jgi:aspartate kinase
MKSLAVAKIGGSILRNPQGMVDALNILEKHPQIKIAIISATFNTTNELEEIAKASVADDPNLENLFVNLLEKHIYYVQKLDLSPTTQEMIILTLNDVRKITSEIRKAGSLTSKNMDSIYAAGELISAQLFTNFLEKKLLNRKVKYIDARTLIKTDSNFNSAKPLKKEINNAINSLVLPFLEDDSLFVIPGFIGSNQLGETTTLGREGSDFSAALLAEATYSTELQIWKDVPGIFTGDPKLIKNAQAVSEISFEEVNRFSEKGAKILFPSALIPVMDANIPVYIGWIHDHKKGTKILRKTDKTPKLIGITAQSEFLRFELDKKRLEMSFLRLIENVKIILEEQKIHFSTLFQDKDRVIFHVPLKERFPETAQRLLEEFCNISKFPNITLLSIVGVEIEQFKSQMLKVVSDLEKEGISLILAEENPNYLTFSFPSRTGEKVLNYVHDKLFLKI